MAKKFFKGLKKIAALTMVSMLLAGGLAGCAGSSEAPAADKAETSTEAPASTETAKKAETRLEKIKEAGVLQVIMEPYFAPYEFIDSSKSGQDQYMGADVELAKYIADEIGVELEIVPLEWTAVLTGISTGKYDMAISGMGYTAERAEAMNLSDSYHDTDSKHGFVVKTDTVDTFTSLDSFTGKRMGFQKGTLQEMYATAQIKDMQPQPFDSVQNAILALQSGKVEAVAVSYDNGELFCEANADLSMATPLFEGTEDHTVVACPKGSDDLTSIVNEAIAKVNEEQLYAQWWDEATSAAKELGVSQ